MSTISHLDLNERLFTSLLIFMRHFPKNHLISDHHLSSYTQLSRPCLTNSMKQTKSTAMSFVLRRRLRLAFAISMLGTIFILLLFNSYSSNSESMNVRRFYSSFLQNQEIDRSVSICCLITTSPRNFLTRAKAINDTWGPRCDRYYFISELANENLTAEQANITRELPIAQISNITRGYDHLTLKSNQAFLFAYEHHLNDSEWFVKADDDTYLIVDHLKAFLREQNSSDPVTFGYNLKVMTSADPPFFSSFRTAKEIKCILSSMSHSSRQRLDHCFRRISFGWCFVRSQSRGTPTILSSACRSFISLSKRWWC